MIKLYLNGSPVALYTDTKIGITAMNPYFNEIGAFSYPFTIPYKPNEAVLLHAARIQSTATAKNFVWEAVLEVDGIQILTGEAVAEGDFPILEGSFPIVLRSAKTSFVKLMETKNMQELEWGIETNGDLGYNEVVAMRSATLNEEYPLSNYVCAPLYNVEAWNEKDGRWKQPDYINNFDPITCLLKDVDGNNLANTITYNFYVRYILKRIIEMFGYTLVADDLGSIPSLNRWFLLSLNNVWGYFDCDYKYAFPKMTIRDFFKVLRQFGIAIIINERNNQVAIKFVHVLFEATVANSTLNGYAFSETICMSMPPLGYQISYKEATDDYITAEIPPATVTVAGCADLPTASWGTRGSIYHSAAAQKYYATVIGEKVNSTDPDVYMWKETGTYRPLQSGTIGTNCTMVEINATVINQRIDKRTVTRTILSGDYPPVNITKIWDIYVELPEFAHKMNSFYEMWYGGAKYEEWPLVFLFNWGLKEYHDTDARFVAKFPVISGDCHSQDETQLGSISMRTHGEKSIISQLVRAEQDWILRRKQKRQSFRLSVLDCANFRWQDTYNISSVNYLVNSLRFDIGTKGISLVEAELFTV